MTDWLQSLKVGDEVAICVSPHGTGCVVEKIASDTATMWVLESGGKVLKSTGMFKTGFMYGCGIEPATEAIKGEIERWQLLRRMNWWPQEIPTLSQLRRIVEILDEPKGGTT